MSAARPVARLRAVLRWLAPIQHWTAVVASVVGLYAVVTIIGVLFGLMDIAKPAGSVVASFYEAVDLADYEAARSLLSNEAGGTADALPGGGWETVVDGLSAGRKVTETEVLRVRYHGPQAVAAVVQNFTDGSFEIRVELLVKQGGRWRIERPIDSRDMGEAIRELEGR